VNVKSNNTGKNLENKVKFTPPTYCAHENLGTEIPYVISKSKAPLTLATIGQHVT
jgi:hypothetical protein